MSREGRSLRTVKKPQRCVPPGWRIGACAMQMPGTISHPAGDAGSASSRSWSSWCLSWLRRRGTSSSRGWGRFRSGRLRPRPRRQVARADPRHRRRARHAGLTGWRAFSQRTTFGPTRAAPIGQRAPSRSTRPSSRHTGRPTRSWAGTAAPAPGDRLGDRVRLQGGRGKARVRRQSARRIVRTERLRRPPVPASGYIESGAEIPSSASVLASASRAALTSVSLTADVAGSAGSITRRSR